MKTPLRNFIVYLHDDCDTKLGHSLKQVKVAAHGGIEAIAIGGKQNPGWIAYAAELVKEGNAR